MLSYLEFALINAVMVVPLAILTEIAGRTFRRPALTHLLWVLILVKLVTPPLWQIPLIDRDWVMSVGRQLIPPALVDVDSMELRQRLSGVTEDSVNELKSQVSPRPRPRTLAARDNRPVPTKETLQSFLAKAVRSENVRLLAIAGLLNVWAFGALIWFVVQGMRCVRFRWALHQGNPAGVDLQRQADRIAQRLGLSCSPTVWLMPGVMSPMLWGSGQSLLLIFPELLLDRLDEDATGTLLTHELSHYRRRDHWVRVLALLTTGFFWWHPVVWWARREIEAVEEECCDAMVVSIAPTAPKRYAEAILDVVDFLAEFELKIPALATGIGQVPFLRQRLTWIMHGPRRQDIGYCGWALCALLVCLLPLQPSWVSARTTLLPSELVAANPLPVESPDNSDMVMVEPASEQAVASIAGRGIEGTGQSQRTPPNLSRWSGFEVRAQSLDGRFVVMGNRHYQSLLNLKTGHEFDLNDFLIQSIAFARNSFEFVSVSGDGVLRLWNAETCEVSRAWQIPGGPAKSVDLSEDGTLIATGGRDGIVRIWNRSLTQPVRELPRELAPINCVRFSHSQDLLAIATGDWMSPQTGRIALVDTLRWAELISMNWNAPAAVVAFHGDGQTLISGDWQGRVARWSLVSGELLGLSSGHKDLMAAAEFSSNSSPLLEIVIPDLPVNTGWDEPEPVDRSFWPFSGWRFNSAGNVNSTLSSGLQLKR